MSKPNDSGFDVIHWPDEAAAVISDVKIHVREIVVSNVLPSTDLEIYLNCEILEAKKYTIRMSGDGFQIVSNTYDKIENSDGFPYETPYALLNEISPAYRTSFGNELTKALLNIQRRDSGEDS